MFLGGGGGSPVRRGMHSFREVVELFEADPVGDGQSSGSPMMFKRRFAGMPIPPWPTTLVASFLFQISTPKWSFAAHPSDDPVKQRAWIFTTESPPPPIAGFQPRFVSPESWLPLGVQIDWDHARIVRQCSKSVRSFSRSWASDFGR